MHVRKSFTLLANDIGLPVLCDTLKVKTTFTHSQTVEALSDCAIDNINVKLDELLHSLAEQVRKSSIDFQKVSL